MVINSKTTRLIKNILLPLLVGAISGILTRNGMQAFTQTAVKPFFMPPNWLFPVAWTILYIMMGYAAYLYNMRFSAEKKTATAVYYIQLFFNFVWSFIFFGAENYLFAFVWITILWVLIIANTILFYRENKVAGVLFIPYLVWVTFAAILNFSVFLLNR